MHSRLGLALAVSILASAVLADPASFAPVAAAEADLAALRWVARPIVVFADSPADPAFAEEMNLLESGWAELAARDVVVITDTDPDARSDLRQKFRPRGFMLVLMDKDGQIILRKPLPWDARELSRAIDKTPLRREELRARPAAP
jgi:Domain of unknown function (DUF4174)